MYCTRCGNRLEDESLFCEKCGAVSKSAKAVKLRKRWKKEKKLAALVTLAAGLVMAAIWTFLVVREGGVSGTGNAESQVQKKEQVSTEGEDEKGIREITQKPEEDVPEYIFEDSDSRILTLEELEALDKKQLSLAGNEILARHGYIFEEEEDKEYFRGKKWYQESMEGEEFDKFSVLNEFEKYNLNNIMFFENKSVEFENIAGTYSVYVSQLGAYLYRFIYPDGININYYAVNNTGYLYSEYMEKKGGGIIINAHGDTYSEDDYITVTDTGIIVGGYTYKKESDQIVSTGELGVNNNTLTIFDDGSGALGDTKGGWWTGEDAYDMELGLYTADYAHHTKYFTYNDCLFSCAIYDIKEQWNMQVGVYERRGDEIGGLESHSEKEQFATVLTAPSYYLSTEKQRAEL